MKHSIIVHITGDLLQPPQVTQTQNGKTVAKARIGVVEEREYQGQKQLHHAQWSVEAWGDLSRILGSVPVGHTIMCEGKLSNESYTGQDGQKKWTTKISAYRIGQCGPSQYPPPQQQQAQGNYQAPQTQGGYQQQRQAPPAQQQRPAQTGWAPPQANGYGAAPTATPGYTQAPPNMAPQQAPPQFNSSEEIPF